MGKSAIKVYLMSVRNFFSGKKKEPKPNKAWLIVGRVTINARPSDLEKYFLIQPQRKMTTEDLAKLIAKFEEDLDELLGGKNE